MSLQRNQQFQEHARRTLHWSPFKEHQIPLLFLTRMPNKRISGETQVTFSKDSMHTTCCCPSQHMMFAKGRPASARYLLMLQGRRVGLEATCHHCRFYSIALLQFNL